MNLKVLSAQITYLSMYVIWWILKYVQICYWMTIYFVRSTKKSRETPEKQDTPQNHADYAKRQNGGATGQPTTSPTPVPAGAKAEQPVAPTPAASTKNRKAADSSYSGNMTRHEVELGLIRPQRTGRILIDRSELFIRNCLFSCVEHMGTYLAQIVFSNPTQLSPTHSTNGHIA